MKKKIFGAITFIAAIGGVIYMKNNPKYKEIVRVVKTADARGFYEKIILEKDKLAFTAKAKIKDYKIDYESIRNVGEKIYTRLVKCLVWLFNHVCESSNFLSHGLRSLLDRKLNIISLMVCKNS